MKLHEWKEKTRPSASRSTAKEESWVSSQPCHICEKVLKGAYGHTTLEKGVVWSCSGVCEQEVQQQRRSYYAAPSSFNNASPEGG